MSANVIKSTTWLGKLKKVITAVLPVANIKIQQAITMVTMQDTRIMIIHTMIQPCSRSRSY
jgi:hypothetical protein